MNTQYSRDNKFGDMARRLSSLYKEGVADLEEAQGAIYSELRRSGDRYTDAEVLARGGMKKVSRVFDTKTGRQVAMAELRANAPAELYEPFLREARLTALLDHPNIISVHDIGLSPDGLPFFTMDLKRGDSLADVLKKNRVSQITLLEIFVKLCDAISYAHSQKVMHLDLKPDNIQIGRFGEVFICDWGLGKVIGSDESEGKEFDEILFNPDLLNNMTLSGELKGTPGYMAPEQFQKNGAKTFQTDIYALGCILYAILTQQPPLKGSPEEIQELTLTGKIVSPTSAFPKKNITKGLNAVVMKALALKPVNRYGSVAALRDDVKSYLSGFSTTAENAGFIKEASLFYKRNRAACLVALLAVTIIVVTTGLFIGELQNSIVEIRRSNELAETKRHEAEVASKQYRDELTRNMRLMGSLSGNLKAESYELSRTFIYSDPVKAVELSIQRLELLASRDPSANVGSQIGYARFIMQDFATANEYFDTDKKIHADLYPISLRFEAVKTNEWLSIEQLAELMGNLKKQEFRRKPLMEKMLVFDYAVREDKTGYEQVVEAVLSGWNQRWTQGRFEYDPRKASLLLRGGQLKEFAIISEDTSGESPLRFLNIKSLDARETGLHDLNQIKDLPLETLDIRRTKVSDLRPINHFPSLRTLIVGRDQFASGRLAGLPKTLKVSVRD
ncbi:serine/threonine-protein kinase [Pontiella sulfatireligans]|uniref:Serine/threonine-protein kinase PknD n=1 Tax=Pontiella sulfatireligans TaxID=2750658 RepID=A0A6C2UGS5_9BACT|nr:serine/threonine-protein kinase [Pontiella sulfatireligans]VGO19412.1 Serine/threonine-protein kinase PknD [Pontiella sulfatireligans]